MSDLYKVRIIETIETTVYLESDSDETASDAALELLHEGFVEREDYTIDLYDVVTQIIDPEKEGISDDICYRTETNTETTVYSKNSTVELFRF